MRPAPDSGACGESGGGTRTRHTAIHPREEVRNRAPRESDVAPPPAAEAKFCAQRLTGGAKWGVVRGILGNVVPQLRYGPQELREGEFSAFTSVYVSYNLSLWFLNFPS